MIKTKHFVSKKTSKKYIDEMINNFIAEKRIKRDDLIDTRYGAYISQRNTEVYSALIIYDK